MSETMTERFQFRLTQKLLQAIRNKAQRLGITPQSVVRYAVAIDVAVGATEIDILTIGAHEKSDAENIK